MVLCGLLSGAVLPGLLGRTGKPVACDNPDHHREIMPAAYLKFSGLPAAPADIQDQDGLTLDRADADANKPRLNAKPQTKEPRGPVNFFHLRFQSRI